jgi:hypothetical protein
LSAWSKIFKIYHFVLIDNYISHTGSKAALSYSVQH